MGPFEAVETTLVEHIHRAVLAQGVGGLGGHAAFLETVRKAGDLVPRTHVPGEVDPWHDLEGRTQCPRPHTPEGQRHENRERPDG